LSFKDKLLTQVGGFKFEAQYVDGTICFGDIKVETAGEVAPAPGLDDPSEKLVGGRMKWK